MDLSFSGCGFLGIYHIGVASCFKQHAPTMIRNLSGASAGALVACCIVADIDFGKATDNVLRLVQKARSRLLGPFHPFFNLHSYMNERLHKVLPDNIHELASGRLFVSLTRVWDKSNVIVSDFKSKEEVIEAVLCSAFVPFYSGMIPPSFRGTKYWDGGLSNNCPTLSPDTVTICPFSGEFDICPSSQEFGDYLRLTPANLNIHLTSTNFWRMSRALYPPEPEKLRKLCQQGYDDTLRYLQAHTALPCNRHLSISKSSSFSLPVGSDVRRSSTGRMSWRNTLLLRSSLQSLTGDLDILQDMLEVDEGQTWEGWDDADFFEEEDQCQDCKIRAEKTMLKGSLPPQVMNAIKEAIVLDNTLLNSLFKFKMMKAVSFMALPYVITLEMVVLFTLRLSRRLPQVPCDVSYFWYRLLSVVRYLLHLCGLDEQKILSRLLVGDSESFLGSLDGEPLPSIAQLEEKMRFRNDRYCYRHQMLSYESQCLPDCVLDTFDLCEDAYTSPRRPSSTSSDVEEYCGSLVDSFDHTVQMTSDMEDVIAYHYLKQLRMIDVGVRKNVYMYH